MFPQWFLKNKAKANAELDRARTNAKRRTQRRLNKFVEDLEERAGNTVSVDEVPATAQPEDTEVVSTAVATNPANTVSVDETNTEGAE